MQTREGGVNNVVRGIQGEDMSWAKRSAANIFPFSENKDDLKLALNEWLYVGDMYDLEKPNETCELCDHPDIRYQFKIKNIHNSNEMLVGSECINKFKISAIDDDGTILSVEESARKVNRDRRHLVEEARKKRLINALIELKTVEEDFDIESFITYEQDRGAFTPKQLFLLLWRLGEHEIEFRPTDFKVVMKRNREKDQLKTMDDWRIGKLWKSFSSSQKKWVRENTNYEP